MQHENTNKEHKPACMRCSSASDFHDSLSLVFVSDPQVVSIYMVVFDRSLLTLKQKAMPGW